eukprot:TRINITY_DN103791_c0_g1_i1.p1 TRINITY_DN103791_c0_g1~~TRINITY_DN103791_c0_g1_i1.p1  ORF type:complete len:120 (+),score=10.25 TRINITY_DN103791_c0_g1_i1:415-774(+)
MPMEMVVTGWSVSRNGGRATNPSSTKHAYTSSELVGLTFHFEGKPHIVITHKALPIVCLESVLPSRLGVMMGKLMFGRWDLYTFECCEERTATVEVTESGDVAEFVETGLSEFDSEADF